MQFLIIGTMSLPNPTLYGPPNPDASLLAYYMLTYL